jgi:hypothetical protein
MPSAGKVRRSKRTGPAQKGAFQLAPLDQALDHVAKAQSQAEAQAALVLATRELNALLSPSRAPSTRASVALQGKLLGSLEDRLKKYFDEVQRLIEKYGPDQYQIQVGFPLSGVTVALTWNVAKKVIA